MSETQSTELVVLNHDTAMTVFTTEGAIDPILEKIANEVRSMVFDVSTPKGREQIASAAYKIARTKTYLDGLGKDLVDELKEVPRKIDASRKAAREFLDNLRDEVRTPLNEWEGEQDRIAAEKKAEEERLEMQARLDLDHEMGLMMNTLFDHQREEERKAAEQAELVEKGRLLRIAEESAAKAEAERLEREAELIAKAKADAEREAKVMAEREAEETAARIKAAEEAQAKAEHAQLEAEANARNAAKEAERQAAFAAELAEIVRLQAIAEEKARIERQELARIAEQARREADTKHRAKIDAQITGDLMQYVGLSQEDAAGVLAAVVMHNISNMKVTY